MYVLSKIYIMNAPSELAEDRDETLARHKREVRDLENKVRFMLKNAKKGNKAELEEEV